MKEINLPSGNYIFISVLDDATDFHYDSWFTRYINHSKGSIKLDVNTEIISTTKDITEEQAKSLIPVYSELHKDLYANYLNNFYIESQFKTAKESLQSLIQANGLDVNKNFLILRKL